MIAPGILPYGDPNAGSWAHPATPGDDQLSRDLISDFVHAGLGDALVSREGKEVENARTAILIREDRPSWDDVHVNVGMIRVLCELDHVGLRTGRCGR
jgi:hypothetical protein